MKECREEWDASVGHFVCECCAALRLYSLFRTFLLMIGKSHIRNDHWRSFLLKAGPAFKLDWVYWHLFHLEKFPSLKDEDSANIFLPCSNA